MKKSWRILLVLAAVIGLAGNALAAKDLDEKLKELSKRVQKLEVKSAKDRINWTGELRVEVHNITGEIPDHFDGMRLQYLMTGSMFAQGHPLFSGNPMDGMDPVYIENFIAQNYGDYLYFADTFTFEQLKGAVSMMPPAQMQQFMQALMPAAFQAGYKTDNDILYTTRLRLRMDTKLAKDVNFMGRLSMYKPWGSSTQVGLFNGQANTMAIDAAAPGVPGGSELKVDSAYFSWKNLFGKPVYLSLGRRPSTGGPPLHYRTDEPRQGTPMGTIIDFQFDGATLGWTVSEKTILRACYGLGFESQYGNASALNPTYAIKDASFFGFNIDAYDTEEMQVQTTVARAFNLTDGFAGYVVLPNNPVTGAPIGAPVVMRYTPSTNLGEFDLASILVSRTDGPLDWFVTGSWSKSRPEDVTTPFGGLFCDPFESPEEQTGSMYYVGARYNFKDGKTKLGLEYNKGSQYWFNFTPAQDDILGAKTATRGTVWEGYLTHRVDRRFVLKLAYISYDYDYSGSGWHLGAPKDLGQTQLLGFPTPQKAGKLSLGFSARF